MSAANSYHHGDLRAELIRLAAAEIAANGVDALSVRALARDAGVAHRAAYQHFPDKDALIAAALTEAYQRLAARLAKIDGDGSPPRRLASAGAALVDFATREPQMFLAMTGPRVNRSGAHKDLEKAIAAAWRYITGPIADGVADGTFQLADKTAAAALFWGGLQGVLAQAALGRLKVKASARNAFFDTIINGLIAGLKAPPPGG